MQLTHTLDALMPGVRQHLLATLLLCPEKSWYMTDLAHHLGLSPSSLQRELAQLSAAGFFTKKPDGNRTYYQANQAHPLFPELRGLMLKTAGLTDVLIKTLAPFSEKIRLAFVFGSTASGQMSAASDVDLLVVGSVTFFELSPTLRSVEAELARPVNVSLYSPAEFFTKLATGHHFLTSVLATPRLFIMGSENDLETLSRIGPGETPPDQRPGTP